MIFHVDGTLPTDGSIFVFGSNISGYHGAGAAKVALQKFGAKYGNGIGLSKQSYAIPTKNRLLQTLPLDTIRQYVDIFVNFTETHPELTFFVTMVGCGLAGYKDHDIAPMFSGAKNCNFPNEGNWLGSNNLTNSIISHV
jgi:hypothetical protein